jgi:hypothetical protein
MLHPCLRFGCHTRNHKRFIRLNNFLTRLLDAAGDFSLCNVKRERYATVEITYNPERKAAPRISNEHSALSVNRQRSKFTRDLECNNINLPI